MSPIMIRCSVCSTARFVQAWRGLAALVLLIACEREAPPPAPKPVPAWVGKTEITASAGRRVFEDNVELSVSLANESAAPVVIDHLAAGKNVVLAGSDGAESELHTLSVGVAKPIVLAPGATAKTSLLFKPLKGEPRALRVYGKEVTVEGAPGTSQK
jgi:hypothetical protein